ncbi:17354_t:CDS:1, partial [Dentiscutata heterogama]
MVLFTEDFLDQDSIAKTLDLLNSSEDLLDLLNSSEDIDLLAVRL